MASPQNQTESNKRNMFLGSLHDQGNRNNVCTVDQTGSVTESTNEEMGECLNQIWYFCPNRCTIIPTQSIDFKKKQTKFLMRKVMLVVVVGGERERKEEIRDNETKQLNNFFKKGLYTSFFKTR